MSYDLIIIGGGPAGITAGIYAARQKLNTLLITKSFGGQIGRKALEIENYPGFKTISGADLIQKFTEHLKRFEITIIQTEAVKVKKKGKNFSVLTKTKKQYQSKTVIIASGADPRPLEVPGEKKFIGKGVSYCTACDAPLFAQKTVAVVGGGNSGFEAATALSSWADKVYILEAGERVRADKENQERVKKTGKVEVLTNVAVKQVKGNNFVESIVYQDKKLKETKTLPLQGIFIEIGSQPSTSFAKDLVEFNERDEIIVDFETCQTKTPGLFAAGDCNVGKFKQIITACGEGAKAALAAYDFLQRQNQ